MAVQAQYPSNVLLLNRNVTAEGKINHQLGNDYNSLNQQSGGGTVTSSRFFDQSHFLLNNIGVGSSGNPRKRGREVNNNQFISSSMQQQQQSQLIDLTQLHSHPQPPPPNVVSTGLRLAFNDQQLHHQQQQQQQNRHHHHQQQQQQRQQQSHQQSLSPQSSVVLSLLSDDLSSQINHQRDEIEHFIQSQAEELRRTLTEKRQRHYRALLGAAEESVARRLREKEAEFEKAARRNAELEARAAQLTAEAQVWQARARAQEATAATLQAQLQQAIMSGVGGGAQNNNNIERGEDGSSAVGDAEDAESAYIDPDRVVVASSTRTSGPGNCKACGKRVASVVLLPCRHLCACTECHIAVKECPVCLSFTNSSIPVFLS